MEISSNSTTQLGQVISRAAIESRYQTARQLDRAAGGRAGEDRLEISTDGRDLARLRGVLLEGVAALPDVREERVAQASARVAAGFYDREDIVAQISDRLLQQSSLPEAVRAGDSAAVPDADYRGDLMQEVNDKIQSGFYSDQEVMRFVADRLMNIYQVGSTD
jgi:hypothetical protein